MLVEVWVGMGESDLEVFIIDHGPGFKIEEVMRSARHGRGLGNMRARALRIDGAFEVRSIPGYGTVVEVSVPRYRLKRELGEERAAREREIDMMV